MRADTPHSKQPEVTTRDSNRTLNRKAHMTFDRYGAALAAITLIEKPDDPTVLDALLPKSMDVEAATVTSGIVWAARFLAAQLAGALEVSTEAVLAALRAEVIQRFTNYERNNDE